MDAKEDLRVSRSTFRRFAFQKLRGIVGFCGAKSALDSAYEHRADLTQRLKSGSIGVDNKEAVLCAMS